MHFVLPYHAGDAHLAKQWIEWAVVLGGVETDSLILMPTVGLESASMADHAARAFASVEVKPDYERIEGHPEGPNSMMRQAAWHAYNEGWPVWMFIEPDCLPLKHGWSKALAAEFDVARSHGKNFMGEIRKPEGQPPYLTGNMVMTNEALNRASRLTRKVMSRDGQELAFDVAAAEQILPQAHETKLIQQVPKAEADNFQVTGIRPEAVLFHPVKSYESFQRIVGGSIRQQSMAEAPASEPLPTTETVMAVAEDVRKELASPEPELSIGLCVKYLATEAANNGLAKARIVMALQRAGLIEKTPKVNAKRKPHV